MSWVSYPAESGGSESTWENQGAHGPRNYDGPSGAQQLIMSVILLIILFVSLVASFFDHAENTTITNSRFITQIQACSTGTQRVLGLSIFNLTSIYQSRTERSGQELCNGRPLQFPRATAT